MIDDVRFEFAGDAEALAAEEIDVEYTEAMCQGLMGCTDLTHNSLTADHLEKVLRSDSANRGGRYEGATLTKVTVGDGLSQILYAVEDGKIYVRARKNPFNDAEGWTLKRA